MYTKAIYNIVNNYTSCDRTVYLNSGPGRDSKRNSNNYCRNDIGSEWIGSGFGSAQISK